MPSLKYSTFAELRKDLRGSTSWASHIDEIAETVFQTDEQAPHKHALFDSFEDFEDDDD